MAAIEGRKRGEIKQGFSMYIYMNVFVCVIVVCVCVKNCVRARVIQNSILIKNDQKSQSTTMKTQYNSK